MIFLETLSIIMFLLIGKVSTALEACDYYQELKPGVVYTIASPKYPKKIVRGADCRWAAETEPGYKISLDCFEVRLPPVYRCGDRVERILVSTSGKANLSDAKRRCGSVSFTEISASTRMTIALKTGPSSYKGGRFKCSLRAVTSNCSCGQLNRGRIGEFCRNQFVKV
jgi:CUB domain